VLQLPVCAADDKCTSACAAMAKKNCCMLLCAARDLPTMNSKLNVIIKLAAATAKWRKKLYLSLSNNNYKEIAKRKEFGKWQTDMPVVVCRRKEI